MTNISEAARLKFITDMPPVMEPLGEIFETQPKCVADIGACEGLSTLRYASFWPSADFRMWEPRKDCLLLIEENLAWWALRTDTSTFHVYPDALGETTKRVPLWESYGDVPSTPDWNVGNKSSSLRQPQEHLKEHAWCKFREGPIVQVRTLDSFELPIDFVHIDVQGYEREVLAGGSKTLEGVQAIYSEVSLIEAYTGQALKGELEEIFRGLGMHKVWEKMDNDKWGDVLYAR